MSYNSYFYNNFHGSNYTFQIPPQPPPPSFFGTPQTLISDQDFVRLFELKTYPQPKERKLVPSISEVKENLQQLITFLNKLKKMEKKLSENIETLSNDDWKKNMLKVNKIKSIVDSILSEINSSQLDLLKKLIAKRKAKRLRLKRVNERRKREKEKRIEELQERSRKIDENLQKIKDDINKAKQVFNYLLTYYLYYKIIDLNYRLTFTI